VDLAEERAPDGFSRIEEVFAPGELEAIADAYKKLAGFDPARMRVPGGRGERAIDPGSVP
jgi:hypothetical protein